MTSVTPPGKSAHSLEPTDVDLLWKHTSPVVGGSAATSQWDYDKDRRPWKFTRADSATPLEAVWDQNHTDRLLRVVTADGTYTPEYDPATGALYKWTAPGAIVTQAGLDGPRLVNMRTTWGTTTGLVTWGVDGLLRVNEETVTGGWPVAVSAFDPDGKIGTATVAGKTCTVGLVASTGWTKSLKVDGGPGKVVFIDVARHPGYGDVSSITAKYNGTAFYTATYPAPDGLGRLTGKTEVPGTATTYSYNAAGRLLTADGNTFEYDANGNRTKANTSYDARDRISSYDGVTYTYNAAGELTNKSDGTSYTYDRRGQLTGATVNLQSVTYELDALGRRVGRSATGTFAARRYLYGPGAQPLAQLSMAGVVEAQYVYLTGRHAPDLMVKSGGVVYALVTDHLGSVRMVVNVDTGVVAQRISYDAWGNATYEVGTWDVQPFGFAGGLYDPLTKLVHLPSPSVRGSFPTDFFLQPHEDQRRGQRHLRRARPHQHLRQRDLHVQRGGRADEQERRHDLLGSPPRTRRARRRIGVDDGHITRNGRPAIADVTTTSPNPSAPKEQKTSCPSCSSW